MGLGNIKIQHRNRYDKPNTTIKMFYFISASPFRLYVTDFNRNVYSIDETGAVAQEFGFDDAFAIAIDPLMSKTGLPELVYGYTTLHRRSIMGGADESVLNVTGICLFV